MILSGNSLASLNFAGILGGATTPVIPGPPIVTFPGSTTLASIIQRVQQNVFDSTGIFADHDSIRDSIQDGYDEILIYTECVEATTSVPFAANSIYYDLYSNIPGFFRITKLFNQSTNRWVRCVDSRVLDKFRFDWELASGTPWFAHIVNFRYLAFFPHYTNAPLKSFDVFYKKGQDVLLSDTQVPQVPPPYDRCIEMYATADILEQEREFSKATNYLLEYYELREKLRTQVMSRMLPDRYDQYNDLDWPAIQRIP